MEIGRENPSKSDIVLKEFHFQQQLTDHWSHRVVRGSSYWMSVVS